MEVLAEMVTKAPTRVAIVEPCLGEPKDFEVLFLWKPIQILILRLQGVQGDLRECGSSWFWDIWKCLLCARQRDRRRCSSEISPSGGFHLLPNLIFDLIWNDDQEKSKVRREAEVLRSLIQSAFVVQLVGLFESPLNSVLVTEYLAGGDLITR